MDATITVALTSEYDPATIHVQRAAQSNYIDLDLGSINVTLYPTDAEFLALRDALNEVPL